MTPGSVDRLVRVALRAIFEGDGELQPRLNQVAELIEKLPPADRRAVVKKLKPKFARAARMKTATLRHAGDLPDSLQSSVASLTRQNKMEFSTTTRDESLLAGFTLQLGDDRHDYSLLARLKQF
jgi:F0F1-type ATP synthase delta subunit